MACCSRIRSLPTEQDSLTRYDSIRSQHLTRARTGRGNVRTAFITARRYCQKTGGSGARVFPCSVALSWQRRNRAGEAGVVHFQSHHTLISSHETTGLYTVHDEKGKGEESTLHYIHTSGLLSMFVRPACCQCGICLLLIIRSLCLPFYFGFTESAIGRPAG